MKKLAVLGIDNNSILLTLLIKKQMYNEFEIDYICDFSDKYAGNLISSINVPIILLNQIKELYEEMKIDGLICCSFPYIYTQLTEVLHSLDISKIYIVPYYFSNYFNNFDNFSISECILEIDVSKPCLSYYEYHITDHCNLNCKGCGHVSNICDENFADFESYKNDLKRLKELFGNCQKIKLLGGEPLLNPELPLFAEETRKAFPCADIHIGTNGLLIPKMSDELADVMRRSNIWFLISSYKPSLSMQDEIRKTCTEKGISYCFTENGKTIEYFSKCLRPNKLYNTEEAYKSCIARNTSSHGTLCYTLRDGKIAQCGVPFYTDFLNKKMGANFRIIPGKDYFDIYEENDGWELCRKLSTFTPACSYCGVPIEFEWQASGKKDATPNDYIVFEESSQ